MNKLRTILTWGLLLAATHVMGYTITVNPIEIEAGQSTNLIINLNNTETNLTAYQMKLFLPTGVTVQKKANGKYAYTSNADRLAPDLFTVTVKDAADGSVLIAVFSPDKDVIAGTSGELIRLPIDVASTVTTSLQGSLKEIEFTDVNNQAYNISDVNFTMTMQGSGTPDPGVVTGDVTVSVPDVAITAGSSTNLIINMQTDLTNLTAYQMKLYLPTGVTVQKKANGKYAYTSNADRLDPDLFTVTVKDAADGSVLIAVFSPDKDVIAGTSGELIRLPIDVASTVTTSLQGSLKEIEFTDVNNQAYNISDVNFTMTMGEGDEQTLSLASLPAMTYGDAAYTLPATTAQGQTLAWTSSNTSVATVSGNVLTIKGAGTAIVTASQAGNDQYLPFSKQYTLTVAKAALTITADDKTKQQGEANPELTVTYSGFVYDEDASVLTTPPTVTTTATTDSPAGTYPITVSGAAAANYNITYVSGTLTVTEGPVVIEVTDISQLDNVIYIDPVEVHSGTQDTLYFAMKNTAEIRGFEFNLYLPDGVTVVKSERTGKIQGSLIENRLPEEDEHRLSFSEHNDNEVYIKVLCGSEFEETFTDNDGIIIALPVNISEDMEDGEYPIILRDIKLSENDIRIFYETESVTSVLTVVSYILGDINGDGKVDVSDYIGVANHIHGKTPVGFVRAAADVDGSGNIDISDYIGIANIIHTGSPFGSGR